VTRCPDAAPEPKSLLAAQLASTFARLRRGGDPGLLARTVALLCQERAAGHVCVPLPDWAGRAPAPAEPPFPALPDWRSGLLATGLCGDGDPRVPAAPLVLDARHRLYLLRHYRDEQRILDFVRGRLARPPLVPAAALRDALAAAGLLPGRPAGPDWQLAAVVAAARSSFAVLTGGPGTGKTTTVARLLDALLALQPDLRVAVAAPTGKAAARLGEALRERATAVPAPRGPAGRLQPSTLHRLLGYLPLDDTFRHGPELPLPYDFVVVDEASMVDPAVLAALCSALLPEARLLLVGDRDQLAAVAAGQVLGDLCRAARPERGVGRELAGYVAAATGMALPVQDGAPAIADLVVALRQNHRFGDMPGLGAFAEALARRDPDAAMAALRAGHRDLLWAPDTATALAAIADALVAAATAETPAAAVAALGSVRVLCAARHGPHGTDAWNRRVEALLAGRGVRTGDRWYRGRPVLVTENDHQNQLWNGDLGVAWPDDGRPQIVFPAAGDEVRTVPAARLPQHETAWAMTVHKAQGSEFAAVLLAMPDAPSPLWQAPLVYTAVTRARHRAIVVADPELLRAGLQHWPARGSGLADGVACAGEPSADRGSKAP